MLFSSTIAVMSIERVEFMNRLVARSEIPMRVRSRTHMLGIVYDVRTQPDGTTVAYAATGAFAFHSILMQYVANVQGRSVGLSPESRYETMECLSYLPCEKTPGDPARIVAAARGLRPESGDSEEATKERLWHFCAGLWHATTLAMSQDPPSRFTVTPDMVEAIQQPGLPLADVYTEPTSWR